MTEQQQATPAAPPPPPPIMATTTPAATAPETIDIVKYKAELALEIGLPSSYAMGLLKTYCEDLVSSGMAPTCFGRNPMALYMAAMRGREMGLSPTESIMETFWVAPGNRLGMYSGKQLQLLQKKGVLVKVMVETAQRCEVLFTPPAPHEPYLSVFDFEEARIAGLVKADSNWFKWPKDMCKARATGRGWRAISGTVIENAALLYNKEELEDAGYEPVPGQDPEAAVTVEVKAGTRKKASAEKEPVTVEAQKSPDTTAPAAPAAAAQTEAAVKTEEFNIFKDGKFEEKQGTFHIAGLRANAIANEFPAVTVTIERHLTFTDGNQTKGEVFRRDGKAAPAAQTQPASAEAAADPAKEAIKERKRAAYATIPGASDAVRKAAGDAFLCGFFDVPIPREFPRDIAKVDAGVAALEVAVRATPAGFNSPANARSLGALAASGTGKSAAVDPKSALLYKSCGWSESTVLAAQAAQAAILPDPEDFKDYVEFHKLNSIDEFDAAAWLAVAAVSGRGTDNIRKLKDVAEKHTLSYSVLVKGICQEYGKTDPLQLSAGQITEALAFLAKKEPPAPPAAPAAEKSDWD